jgi:outer membrane cobalamin receptor
LATSARPYIAKAAVVGFSLSLATGLAAAEDRAPTESAAATEGEKAAGDAAGRDLFQLDLENLGRVEAAPSPANAAPSSTLSRDEVRDSSAASTGELLQDAAASVTARRTSALNLDPIVRGYNSQQVSAAANGMTQLKTRVDVDSLFSQIDPGIVDGITVVDGPYASLYGPGFAFLVADLFPTSRSETQTEVRGSTQFAYESNGQALYARENLFVAGTDYGVAASYGIRSGNDYEVGDWDGFFVPASHKKWDTFLAISRDFAEGQSVDFNYLRTEINGLELPGVTYDLQHSHNDQFNLRYAIRDERQGPERFVLQTWLHDTAYSANAASAAKQRTFIEQFITAPSRVAGDDTIDIQGRGRLDSMGVRSYVAFGEPEQVEWTLGVDFRRYSLRYAEADVNRDGTLAWGGNLFGIPGSVQEDLGAFAHIRMPLTETWEILWGGRVDHVESRVRENDAVITQFGDPSQLYYVPGFERPSHLLGMAYMASKLRTSAHVNWNAGVAFAMRAPSLAELYSDEPYVPMIRFGNSYIDGNSSLDAEKNVQIDFGLAYTRERWSWGARAFMANIFDYVLTVPSNVTPTQLGSQTNVMGRDFSSFPAISRGDIAEGTPNADQSQAGYRYSNVDYAVLYGGDLYAEVPLAAAWSLGGTLSYVEGVNYDPQQFEQDISLPSSGRMVALGGQDSLPGIYPLSGTIELRWFEPEHERYGLEFASRLVAEQDRVAATLAELPTDGFIVCSIRGHWQATQNLRLTAAVENLFDVGYTQHGSLVIVGPSGVPTFVPEPGISAVFGADLRY